MKFISISAKYCQVSILAANLLIVFSALNNVHAQFLTRYLAIGDLHSFYSAAGAHHESQTNERNWWPGINTFSSNNRGEALQIGVANFTDRRGTWPVKVAHVGPRISGLGEVFPVSFKTFDRFDPPIITVDGDTTVFRPYVSDNTDATIKADRMFQIKTNSVVGISLEQTIRAWSQEYHDDYHIIEYTFTNTGEGIDSDDDSQLNQTLEGVYFYLQRRYNPNNTAARNNTPGGGHIWGKYTMNDATWDGISYADLQDVDFRAQWAWMGQVPGAQAWNTIGGPIVKIFDVTSTVKGDTVGRLAAAHHVGTVILHADGEAHDPNVSVDDDPLQPVTMHYFDTDDPLTGGGVDQFNKARMQEEYERFYQAGRQLPTHATIVKPTRDFANQTDDPSLGRAGGNGHGYAFGPYTMAPGEVVKIVIAEGVGGLSYDAALKIGKAYRASNFDDSKLITYGGVSMTKNQWVMTSRDSLFQTFRRAIANYEVDYNIPSPPLPPKEFHATQEIGFVRLEWDVYPNADHESFEIYRAVNDITGIVEANQYKLLAELPGIARSYADSLVLRGLNAYYYIQSVGSVNTDNNGLTPTGVRLKSNRYYTQTSIPVIKVKAPPDKISDARVVPNPYNLGQDLNLRWPGTGQKDLIKFMEIPGEAVIKIYTEIGELVKTIHHTDGSADDEWYLTTESNQVVASGIYLAVIEDSETGEQVIRKFVIIR